MQFQLSSDPWSAGAWLRLPPLSHQAHICFPPLGSFSWKGLGEQGKGSPYLEQGLAAEVHQEKSLGWFPSPGFAPLEELSGEQHRVLQDLAFFFL